MFAPKLKPVSQTLQSLIRFGAGTIIGHTLRHSQGLYTDGWAARLLRYVVPRGPGPLIIEGNLPVRYRLRPQKLRIDANGHPLGEFPLPFGDFRLVIELPPEFQDQSLRLEIKAARWWIPNRFTLRGDRRRLAYRLTSIRRGDPPEAGQALPQRVSEER
jgi:hypothetical protein